MGIPKGILDLLILLDKATLSIGDSNNQSLLRVGPRLSTTVQDVVGQPEDHPVPQGERANWLFLDLSPQILHPHWSLSEPQANLLGEVLLSLPGSSGARLPSASAIASNGLH